MKPDLRLTLDELVDQVADSLSSGYEGQASGRVRDLPDRRAVRYYTTLGLVDRPSGWRGRVALYGERHLLQLVAIKRLQALGLTLAEVQREVTGRNDAGLRLLATQPAGMPMTAGDLVPGLSAGDAAAILAPAASPPPDTPPPDTPPPDTPPPDTPPPDTPSPKPPPAAPGTAGGPPPGKAQPDRRRFWAAAQATSTDTDTDTDGPADHRPPHQGWQGPGGPPGPREPGEPHWPGGPAGPSHHQEPDGRDTTPPGVDGWRLDGATLQAVGLAPGVVLLVERWRPLGEQGLRALRAAAAPLLDAIGRLGLDRRVDPPGATTSGTGREGTAGGTAEPAPAAPPTTPHPTEGDDDA